MGEVEQRLLGTQLEQLQPIGLAVPSEKDFERLGLIGQTHGSSNHLVRRHTDGQLLCLKSVQAEKFPGERATELLHEVEVLKLLDGHPHIIGYGGSFLEAGTLSIVLELADNGCACLSIPSFFNPAQCASSFVFM